jgi:hypothetical protein
MSPSFRVILQDNNAAIRGALAKYVFLVPTSQVGVAPASHFRQAGRQAALRVSQLLHQQWPHQVTSLCLGNY